MTIFSVISLQARFDVALHFRGVTKMVDARIAWRALVKWMRYSSVLQSLSLALFLSLAALFAICCKASDQALETL